MSNYIKATDFASKDALPSGDALKTLSGTELDDEFNDIATASATKANASGAVLTGVPVAPTAATGTDTTQLATTAFVQANDALQANLASPTFTGTPAAPTAAADTNTTQLATTAFVTTEAALKADLASPALTGTPTAPTAAADTNTTQLATTAFVTTEANLKADLAGATFTGDITATGVDFGGPVNAGGVLSTSNTLDDYEEGTWTPYVTGSLTVGSPTYYSQVGHYEKIGRQVTVRGYIVVNQLNTLDGSVRILGLPFASNSTVGNRSVCSFGRCDSLAISAGESVTGQIVENTSQIVVYVWSLATGTSNMDDAELSDTAELQFTATYSV